MLKPILAIAGRPGLYRLVSSGKNMLIVESLKDKRRIPAYSHDKVISLGDISMYTDDEEVALSEVLDSVKTKNSGKPVDIKAIGGEKELREYFGEILPNYDRDRVYTNDIKKLLTWYNILIEAGVNNFKVEVVPGSKAPRVETEESAEEQSDKN